MIISRDHNTEMTPTLKVLVEDLSKCSTKELPLKIEGNLLWEGPKGDLFHWIPVLNRFDDIFENQIKKYGLDKEKPDLKVMEDCDQYLVASCLDFTHLLYENCANRSIYASTERIYLLINSCTIEVRLKALELVVSLTERHARYSPRHSVPKQVKDRAVAIARSFPPPVPSNFSHVHNDEMAAKPDEPTVIGDHFALVDAIDPAKRYPSKWKSLHFQYYKSVKKEEKKERKKKATKVKKKDSKDSRDSKDSKDSKDSNDPKKDNSSLKSRSDADFEEGLFTFKLSEESVRKMSLQSIFDKGSDVISQDALFEFGLVAPVVKSFSSSDELSIQLRHILLRIKCLAIAFVSCIRPSDFASSKLFESEPYIFSFLVDIIQPETSHVDAGLYHSAVRALECISAKRIWGGDLIRSLGGTIGHGTLFHILRDIKKSIENDTSKEYEIGYVHFFKMLNNLIETRAAQLASGGILAELMSFLGLETDFKRTISSAVNLIRVFLAASPDSFEEFVNKNGFPLIIDTIGHEVRTVKETPWKPDSDIDVMEYSISYRSAAYIETLFDLVTHLIRSHAGDRLRNLYDSPLLKSLNEILLHPKVFGPYVLKASVDSIYSILDNEPTAISILNEAKVIENFLGNLEALFYPSGALLSSLLEALGAVCLNNDGLKSVMDKGSIKIFFTIFFDPDYAKELLKSDWATTLGYSFEELGRHYPTLKPVILEQMKNLVEQLNLFVKKHVAFMSFYTSSSGSLYHLRDEEDFIEETGAGCIDNWKNNEVSNILDAVLIFLGGLIHEGGQWSTDAMKEIKYEEWAEVLASKNSSYDYTTSDGLANLMEFLKFFDDENRNYGLPVIVKMLKLELESPIIQRYLNYDGESFFGQVDDANSLFSALEASITLRHLNAVHTLLYTLTEIYVNPGLMFHERYHQVAELFGGYGLGVIKDLGKLLKRSVVEEITLRSNMPDKPVMMTTPLNDGKLDIPPLQVFPTEPPAKPEKEPWKGTSAKYKNSLQLRFFAAHFQNYISVLFSSVGRVAMHKRQEMAEASWRRDAVDITIELGKVMAGSLDISLSSARSRHNYLMVMVNIASYVMSLRGRNKDVVQTSLVVSLIQNGFFNKLCSIGIELWRAVLALSEEESNKSKDLKYISIDDGSIMKNALSQLLVVFAKCVNSESVPAVPSSKLFFHDGYDLDPETSLPSAVLVQVRTVALEFISGVIQIEKSTGGPSSNVPTPVVDQLIFTAKQTWQGRKEQDVRFVPFDSRNVAPPSEQVAYLISLGMPESDAEHYFKHIHGVLDLATSGRPECPQFSSSSEKWDECARMYKEDPVDLQLEFPSFVSGGELRRRRDEGMGHFLDDWISVALRFPKTVGSVADLLLTVVFRVADVVTRLLDHVVTLVEVQNKRNDELAVVIHLLSIVLQNDRAANSSGHVYARFQNFVVSEITNNSSSINDDYFAYSLYVVEQMLIFRDYPVVEHSKHEAINSEINNEKAPYLIEGAALDAILRQLLQVDTITSTKTAGVVARILILYAKENATVIATSPLIKALIQFSKTFMETSTELFESYQTSLMVLVRRCYESKEFLRTMMGIGIDGAFTGLMRPKKDLQAALRESAAHALRDPEAYVDAFGKVVRIEGYDGTKELNPSKITVTKESDSDASNNKRRENRENHSDVEMEDVGSAPASGLLAGQSGPGADVASGAPTDTSSGPSLVHVIITELMNVLRYNIFSDATKDKEEAAKKPQPKPIYRYVCFLLQALSELVGSYKQAKLDFLTFSKKQRPNEGARPRSTALNFFFHQLIPTKSITSGHGTEYERRTALSSLAKLCLIALISSCIINDESIANVKREDIDVACIRRFFFDILLKVLASTTTLPVVADERYQKLLDILDLCGSILSSKSRDIAYPLLDSTATKYDQYYFARAFIEKHIPDQITAILAEIDLNYPHSGRILRVFLKPLLMLGNIKTEFAELFEEDHQGDKEEDEIVPDDGDDGGEREEAPDLFRHSTLGMYDAEDSEDDEMYYEDDFPMELMSSEEEIASDGSLALSAIDSGDDEDDEVHGHPEGMNEEGYQEETGSEEFGNDSEIEIIDEIDMDDGEGYEENSEGGEYEGEYDDEYSDEYGDEYSDEPGQYSDEDGEDHGEHEHEHEEFTGFADDDQNNDELDILIEELDDDERSYGSDSETSDSNTLARTRRNTLTFNAPHDSDDAASGSDDNELENDSASDNEFNDRSGIVGIAPVRGGVGGPGHHGLASLPSILDSFRADRYSVGGFLALLSSVLGGDGSRFRGSIQIEEEEPTVHLRAPHSHAAGTPSFERTFESVLQLGPRRHANDDSLAVMDVRSTAQRWSDSMEMFYEKDKDVAVNRLIPAIVTRIEDPSVTIFIRKREEAERVRSEREEKQRKREEERRERREKEAAERERERQQREREREEQGHDGDESGGAPGASTGSNTPVMVRIGERMIDISGTDIDPEFFEALPDDMRQEVFTQHVRERRANATSTGTDAREIDPDFLEALPDQIREEILQQESMARRYSGFDSRLDDDDDEFGDDDGFFADDASERGDEPRAVGGGGSGATGASRDSGGDSKKSKRKLGFFTPLVDRSGVAAVVRLLFAPQSIAKRDHIHRCLQYLCRNKQSRIEVMSLLLEILYEGIGSQRAVERSYSQISQRATAGAPGSSGPPTNSQMVHGATPAVVGMQVLEALLDVLEHNVHLRYYLLTDHENVFFSKRANQKAKRADEEHRYPVNVLLLLLMKDLVKEEHTLMDVLTRVLQISTRPLSVLKKSQDNERTPLGPPVIPLKNFSSIIQILTAKECSNSTFRRTISAMENLSVLPKAQLTFLNELSAQATRLGQVNTKELAQLTSELKQGGTYNTDGKSVAKFSAASSDQAKLLRVLTALDYMCSEKRSDHERSEPEKATEGSGEGASTSGTDPGSNVSLTHLYKSLALGSLWDALSETLRVIEEDPKLTKIATALLPLMEALMVVCKHSKVKDIQIKDVARIDRKIDFTKEPIELLFFSFTDEHKKLLNQMVRTNPNLMSGPFGMLVRNPKVLEFDNKKNYFDRKLHADASHNPKMLVSVRREQVFLDSYRSLFFKATDEFKRSKLEINFKGEAGVDAGGVTREWYQVLSRQMFNPDYALFTPVASDETTFHPNRTSYVNPEHLSFFKFIGRIIGKAIYDGMFLDSHFSRAVYKRILGTAVSLKDMETLDLEYFNSLMWMLENDITDVITEDFSVETDDYGEHKIIDLVENGRNIPVVEENKHDYVRRVVEYRLQTSVADQMDNLLMGFHEVIPKDLVAIFDEQELELLISGLPDIDVVDWQNNTVYNNYSPSSLQAQWFWRAVKSFDNEERAKLLQFATGTSKVPLNGFKELSGSDGTCKFNIHRDYGPSDRLPSSHTCFNQIDLPAYSSYETLRGALLLAITEGHEGFGMA